MGIKTILTGGSGLGLIAKGTTITSRNTSKDNSNRTTKPANNCVINETLSILSN
jgi:hypothetical protein